MQVTNSIHNNPQYANWLSELKDKVRNARIRAAVTVNSELLSFYWELGADIVQKQSQSNWGDGFLLQLSKDLMAEFPDVKGFSVSNLKYIKQWYPFYTESDTPAQIAKQAVSQLPSADNKENSQQAVGQIGQQAVAQLKRPDAFIIPAR